MLVRAHTQTYAVIAMTRENQRNGGRKARSGGKRPTVEDVARVAGVSPMTVSRVINGGGNVLGATRAKVDDAIARLDYVPNPAARNLAGGKTCRIALLYANPSSAYLSEFLMGSMAQASTDGAQLIVEYCGDGLDADMLVRNLSNHRVDAVLLPPPLCDDARLLDRLGKAGLPMAQIATGEPSPACLAVTIDDEAAAHELTRHLIGIGHQRIGFISGNTNQTVSALRRAGYERALREAFIAVDPELIVPGDFSYRSGMEGAETLLARSPRPTAILASNDDMAAAAVAVAHRHGLDVPGEISVCGFDDTAMATTIWPELTTIRQPIADMARQATRMLVKMVASNAASEHDIPQHSRLEYDFVRRDSDGPPPA